MYRGPKHPAASSSETEATSALKRELFNFCNVLSFLEQRQYPLPNGRRKYIFQVLERCSSQAIVAGHQSAMGKVQGFPGMNKGQ